MTHLWELLSSLGLYKIAVVAAAAVVVVVVVVVVFAVAAGVDFAREFAVDSQSYSVPVGFAAVVAGVVADTGTVCTAAVVVLAAVLGVVGFVVAVAAAVVVDVVAVDELQPVNRYPH